MIFRRKKIKCSVGPAPNLETIEFFFHGDHWSYFFPDVNGILEKGLKPCRWKEITEDMVTYSIATDDFHHTLICEDGEVHIHDNNYGLSVFVNRNAGNLFRRIQKVLEESGRIEVVFNDVKEEEEPRPSRWPSEDHG